MQSAAIERAKEHFGKLLEIQMKRMEQVKAMSDWIDYATIKPVKIGIIPGDGIGPFIATESRRVLEFLLKDEVKAGKVWSLGDYDKYRWQAAEHIMAIQKELGR